MAEPFIETISGKKVHFLNPTEAEIDLRDIAYALSNICRFNGHVPFYSVAEHSIMVAAKCGIDEKLAGLLHDAAEAYLSDIPSPVKDCLPEYKTIERNLQTVINKKFGVNTFTESVKRCDQDATYTEAYYLLKTKGRDWVPKHFTPKDRYKPMNFPPAEAFKLFMSWHKELTASPILLP
ncbi:MAG: hypothetical protein KGI54_10675 [Pseudomonadota bacterium]|nr:hypothetical protein [Pseudomonadota bacterium]